MVTADLPFDAQLLLALLDLRTISLLAECEAIIEDNANVEAQLATQELRDAAIGH